MAMVSSISLPFPPEIINSKRRDASFSSFLNAAEENFVHNLISKDEDGEIGVFGAEKYFNGGIDSEAPLPSSISARKLQSEEKEEKLDIDSMAKQKIPPGTPSSRSEASWNSQSSLLKGVLKIPEKSKTNRGKRFLSRCNCSCCDKTSVDVMEDFGDIKAPNPSESRRDERKEMVNDFRIIEARSWLKEEIGETFTFPISKPESGNFSSKMQNVEVKEEEKTPRKSLESLGNRSFSFPRSKTKIREGTSPEEELQSSAKNGGHFNDDTSSDCSSDLFEIESFTGKSIHCLRRQSSDSTSCFTPMTCYAPSEVSIEWSVITASAADFSAASDYDSDQKPGGEKSGNLVQKRRSGILLGCKNQKAVGVASAAYRKPEKASPDGLARRRPEWFPPLTSHEAVTKQTGLSSKQKNQALASLSNPKPAIILV